MENILIQFIQSNSPDGGFLQSEYWREFQESVGRKTFSLRKESDNGNIFVCANMMAHTLPIVGKYFYAPRGPVIQTRNSKLEFFFDDLIKLAKKNDVGWIRIEPKSDGELEMIRNIGGMHANNLKIVKSSVDMQPVEILMLDISKSEEELLVQMKQKTRYNIRLAEKRRVSILWSMEHGARNKNWIEEFLKLVKITAERDKIAVHPDNYYRKMFEIIPSDILRLYIAKYKGKTIAANMILFFGKTAKYMHGASDNDHRDVMAPHLLQWQAIRDAKKAGCVRYDLGGIKIQNTNRWAGITKFKSGFAPNTEPIKFPGCYDIVLKPTKYSLYRILQKIKKISKA
jgi:peptidoglycan pentaglycine glycine transferase (the first glycine)